MDSLLKLRKRKLSNYISSKENDYGNEGFLLELLYFLGCDISLKRIKRECRNQKLKILSVRFQDEELFNRSEIEKNIINQIISNKVQDFSRVKRTLLSVAIDNYLLYIIQIIFKIKFEERITKAKADSLFPDRRRIHSIHIGKQFDNNSIIKEGVKFYDMIKCLNCSIIELEQGNQELHNYTNNTFCLK